MVITNTRTDWTRAELGAAIQAGYAIETRRGEPIRLIGRDFDLEMDILGDRVFDALEHRIGRAADALPTFTGTLTEQE